jgi:transposase
VPSQAALSGILFVLRSGIPWEMLPREMGCGSGVTCWRRLRDWQEASVWDRLHRELLRRLRQANRIAWTRACVDSASIAAKREVPEPGRTRRTAARRAPSGTSSPTDAVPRSPERRC